MPRAKSEVEKTTRQSESAAESKTKTKDASSGEATRRKSASAAKSKADDAEAAPRRRAAPAAPAARPSLFDAITQTASKAEAERAAKAAARKAAQATQASQTKPGAPSAAQTKRPSSPFLNTTIRHAATPPSTMPSAESSSPAMDAATATPISTSLDAAPTAQATTVAPTAVGPTDTTAAMPTTPTTTPASAVSTAAAPTTEPIADIKQEDLSPRVSRATTTVKPTAQSNVATKAGPATTMPSRPGSAHSTARAGAPTRSQAPAPARPPRPSTPSRNTPSTTRPASPRPAQTDTRPTARPTQAPARPAQRPAAKPAETVVPKPVVPLAPPTPAGPIAIPNILSVRELATLLHVPLGDLIKRLMTMKIFATVNQAVDFDTATLIAEEFDLKVKSQDVPTLIAEVNSSSLRAMTSNGDQTTAQVRPPVVTVLGHVDHGKTSLLDAIRHAKVAAGEAGGITQHIGAYQIERGERKLTFLDTPGHEAFTAMRARGAQVTDVAILVVAADDGVMPQTKEAINHVHAANVPMVVALNKIDRETADPNRVMRQLSDANVFVEQWGGDVPMVHVSAKTLQGIEDLLEMILLVTDLAELKANPDMPAVGSVIESQVDRSRGPVATLLVQNGTLRQNDYIVVEGVAGRVRAMFDDKGNRLTEAGPSTPVLVLGLPSAPPAGNTFKVAPNERNARQWADDVVSAQAQTTRTSKTLSLDELYTQMEAGKIHDLNIVLKADVQGSLEPIRNSIAKLSTDNLKVRLLHEGLGNLSESDVSLALASQAIVIGFHVDADPAARKLANSEGVDIRLYDIIYELIEDVDKALKGLLEPTFKDVVSGKADVRQVFKVNKRAVAGCYVTEGKALRAGMARLLRGGKPIFDGRIASLKRFHEDVREVATGFECGVMLEGFEAVQVGDVIEFYHKEKEE